MNPRTIALSLMLLTGVSACTTARHSNETYALTVRLRSRYNRDYTLCAPVAINQPFSETSFNGDVQNSIHGTLGPPVDGRFPLELSITERKSDDSKITEKGSFALKLNEPHTYDAIDECRVLISHLRKSNRF